ncbi:hypothetical protein SALBM311S_04789 [Streptomyces alboniger]
MFWQPVEDYDNMKPGGESAKGGHWGSILLPVGCTSNDTLKSWRIYPDTKCGTARTCTDCIRVRRQADRRGRTSSAAAVTKDGKGASLVHVNSTTAPRSVTIDLSKFRTIKGNATVTPTVTSADGKLQRQAPVKVVDGKATYTVPAQSVTSFAVKGVSGVAKNAGLFTKGRSYTLTGVQSGKAVTVAANGTSLVIGSANGTVAQEWQLDARHGKTGNRQRYVLANPAEGKVLAVRDGVPVVEPDTGERDPATEWIMSTTGDNTWTLVNAGTGRVLEVGGQATNEGAAVTTWQPNSGSNQRWTVTDVTDEAADH